MTQLKTVKLNYLLESQKTDNLHPVALVYQFGRVSNGNWRAHSSKDLTLQELLTQGP